MAARSESDRLLTVMPSVAELYSILRHHYGPQDWWPGGSRFEVMVGAILTQNTAWRNVEKALARLAGAACLSPDRMLATAEPELAVLIRPAGYFNIKARRLHNLCIWLSDCGGIDALAVWETETLRDALLGINGVGPETADDILLYAFERNVFVVDTYTQRFFIRIGLTDGELAYEKLKRRVEVELAGGTRVFGQFHALIVEHAKLICRKKPLCKMCSLRSRCTFGSSPQGPAR